MSRRFDIKTEKNVDEAKVKYFSSILQTFPPFLLKVVFYMSILQLKEIVFTLSFRRCPVF